MNVQSIGRKFVYVTMGVATCLCLSRPAAAVSVSIDDLTDLLSFTTDAQLTSQTVQQEGVGILGYVGLEFEFLSADVVVGRPGLTTVISYAIYEPNSDPLVLSDTLRIILTTLDPTINGTNVRVIIDFLSDSTDEAGILKKPKIAEDIFETGQFQSVATGLSDLTVQFRSDVSETPLPAALPLFASGLGAFGLLSWRRKKKAAAAAAA